MSARTPYDALRQHIHTIQQALRCVTEYRFMLRERHRVTSSTPYFATLNRMDPVLLTGEDVIYLRVGQMIRVVADDRQGFRVTTVRYAYELLVAGGNELLAFHWTPEGAPQGLVTFPHVHVGTGLLAENTPVRPGEFHRAHVPTARISVESVVKFVIVELGIEPLIPAWSDVLDGNEFEFQRNRTR